MPTYLHPGIFIEEISSGARPIEGGATSIAAFVGPAHRGPAGEAVLIHGLNDYEADYEATVGAIHSETDTMGLAVAAFYLDGGKDAYLCRLVSTTPPAAAASAALIEPLPAGALQRGSLTGGQVGAGATYFSAVPNATDWTLGLNLDGLGVRRITINKGGQPVRYGYNAAHRREDGASGMNTDLTDAEWALVAELIERDGGPGTPARYERRRTVNACWYVLRTGCAWRRLPKTFPPWQATYEAFSRRASAGVFEARHDRLRQQWHDRIGKVPDERRDHRSTEHPQHAPRRTNGF